MTKLTVDGIDIEIGFAELADLISYIKDHEDNQDLFAKLSQHPSARVRRSVADKGKIDQATAEILGKDQDLEVLRTITRNDTFKKVAKDADINRLVQLGDAEICSSIASDLENFENCDASKVIDVLSNSKDPGIRMAIAENWNTPKKVLKKFTNDPDLDVRRAAKRDD
jgi:hypothetical protein